MNRQARLLGACVVGMFAISAFAAPLAFAAGESTAAKPKAMAKPAKKMKQPASVLVKITNSRSVALNELEISIAGTMDSAGQLAAPLEPGKSVSLKIDTKKNCSFDVHGTFADESETDASAMDLCKDPKITLKD